MIIIGSILLFTACKSKKSTDADRNINVIYPEALNKSSILTDTGVGTQNSGLAVAPAAARPKAETKIIYIKETPEKRYSKQNSGSNDNVGTNNSNQNNTENSTNSSTTASTPRDRRVSKAAQGAVIGAGSGAVIGTVVSNDKGKGAVVGAILGAGAGYAIGRNEDKKSGRVNRKRAIRRNNR